MKRICGGIGSLALISGLLGYFVYGGLNGLFAMVLLSILFNLAILFSIIPFVGVFLQYWISLDYVFPYVQGIAKIEPTWLTTAMFSVDLVIGIIIWGAISLIAAGLINKSING